MQQSHGEPNEVISLIPVNRFSFVEIAGISEYVQINLCPVGEFGSHGFNKILIGPDGAMLVA